MRPYGVGEGITSIRYNTRTSHARSRIVLAHDMLTHKTHRVTVTSGRMNFEANRET
jgi:hypothetical protein